MGLSDWSPKYTVHHPLMDEHHLTLFKLVDKLSEAIMAKKENEVIGEVLDSLLDYTKMHFEEEEHLMSQVNYPDIEKHKEAHKKMLARVLEFQRRLKAGDSSVTAELSQFLMSDWLVKHILGTDELYAPYFKKAFADNTGQNANKAG